MSQITSRTIRIIGVPLDLGASRRGTDVGPSALRIAGLGAALRRMGYDVALEEDIPAPAMETRRSEDKNARYKPQILDVCTRLAKRVREVVDTGDFPLVLGGDHSIAMGTVAGTAAHFRDRDQSIGLIWFDAHGDMNVPGVSPSGNIHGMPLAHLLGKGDADLKNILGFSPKVKPENVALVGIRAIDAGERKIIRDSGIHAFTMREIDEHGMATIARRALEVVNDGTAGFHVSFDVDGCDPTVIPGSGTLVPGGVSFREAHLLMEYVADSRRLLSLEIVELNPFLDERNISARRALELILSAMGKSIL
jgi:arginase